MWAGEGRTPMPLEIARLQRRELTTLALALAGFAHVILGDLEE